MKPLQPLKPKIRQNEEFLMTLETDSGTYTFRGFLSDFNIEIHRDDGDLDFFTSQLRRADITAITADLHIQLIGPLNVQR